MILLGLVPYPFYFNYYLMQIYNAIFNYANI